MPIALSLRWPLLAHGFTVETVGRLVLDGLATATAGTVQAGGRPITVTWLAITDLGRQALTGTQRPRAMAFDASPDHAEWWVTIS